MTKIGVCLWGLLFVLCALAISKAIAVIVPVTFFYGIASFFNINGDEAITDFLLTASIIFSVMMSVACLGLLRDVFRKR